MNRIYFPFREWEDYKAGMFRNRQDSRLARKSADILSSSKEFHQACQQILSEWPKSCTQNLSNTSTNRRAWMGQAACCFSVGATEQETRMGWSMLSDQQREQANLIADQFIHEWENAGNEDFNLIPEVEENGVSAWNPGLCSIATRASK